MRANDRYSISEKKRKPSKASVEAFFDAYEALCKEHGMCLSHEDGQGAFIVEDVNDSDLAWARNAQDNTSTEDCEAPAQ